MTNDGDCKTKNDDNGQQINNQVNLDNKETSLEVEIEGNEIILPGT